MSFRLLSYNIQHGGTGREDAIGSVIRSCEPDIVVFQEAVNPGIVARLALECGMQHWHARAGNSVAVMSRLQISHHAWHKVRFGRRKYLELVLADSAVRIYGVHLSAIHSNLTELRRTFELKSLLSDIRERQDGMHLLTGDFNTLAPGEKLNVNRLPARLRAIVWMTGGNVRWHTIRIMLDHHYVDAYRELHSEPGLTFPTWDPQIRLDYLFVPKRFKARAKECRVITEAPHVKQASDHFPLLSVIDPE